MHTMDKVRALLRHINNVQANCILLGERLIDKGEVKFGIDLIARSFLHDNSKFYGMEFEYLDPKTPERDKLAMAISQHNETNEHHPEFWGSIHYMPRPAVAEMICDWKSRSSEFGTSLYDWIHDGAMKRFQFTKDDPIYDLIMEYATLLCDEPFKPIKPQPT